MEIFPVAHIETDFPEKFGIPRQSGLAGALKARVVFEPQYTPEAFRGLEQFSHIWLLWEFSEAEYRSPTVRPPRLGGNKRVGVFATRSPFRPNRLAMSAVKLNKLEHTPQGTIIHVSGADLMDGTPIYDIKPYLPYVDSIPAASNGFAAADGGELLRVELPAEFLELVPEEKRAALLEVLSQDPRPQYQHSPERVYTMSFAEMEISFRVEGELLTVTQIR
ncbi:MAG: tRNA (N6-threonylcarbamoyladenosine(37)-N6)-methyltransferase TrmO [Oscillospiraceae bacterium]|nr:tRNA (N6-threonylcarbamoyladenosine(37)-N6)-methyltransferase TrmO [Oscillospiraceae bacterium]